MKVPKTIKIAGHTLTVRRQKHLRSQGEAFALFDPETLEIVIDSSVKGTLLWESIWHEVLEALNFFCEAGLEHKSIQVMGMLLQQIVEGIVEGEEDDTV